MAKSKKPAPPGAHPAIFISYSHRDARDLALRLFKDLSGDGYHVWFDDVRLTAGVSWTQKIEEALDAHEVVIALMSHESYTSPICRAEHLRALRKGKLVIPVRVHVNVERPLYFETLEWIDCFELTQYDRSLARIVATTARSRRETDRARLSPRYGRTPVTAPALPPFYIPRAHELLAARAAILAEIAPAPVGVIALSGTAGVGKTVLAIALCEDVVVQSAFPDGVIWVPMGPDPVNVAEKMREVGRALGDRSADGYETEESAANRMRSLLADKAVLLVLDDVWNLRQLDWFLVRGPRTRTFFTSRNQSIGLSLATKPLKLGVFTPEQSIALLRNFAGADDPSLGRIASRLGHFPLALRMAGARLLAGTPPSVWLDEFEEALRNASGGLAANDLLLTLDVLFDKTLDQFSEPERELYLALGVFPPATAIPFSVIARLWGQIRPGVSRHVCRTVLEGLALYCLVEVVRAHKSNEIDAVTVHSMLRDYARHKLGSRVQEIHTLLLDAYNPAGGKWASVSDDGYLHANLAYHLSDARRGRELHTQLLDLDWLKTRLSGAGIGSLLSDYEFAPNVGALRLVQSALRLSATALATDRDQLAGQLLGRLSREAGKRIAALLAHAERESKPWLRPSASTLTSPDGPLRQTLRGHAEGVAAVAVSYDSQFLVSGSDDGTVRVWDLPRGTERHTASGHRSGVKCVGLRGSVALSGSDDGVLRRWDPESGVEVLPPLSVDGVSVKAVAITPDGRSAVAGYTDCVVRVWDLGSNQVRAALAGHTGAVRAIRVTPDGTRAVSASEDGTLKVWSLRSGSECELRSIQAHDAPVWDVALMNADVAVSASWDGTLRFWNISDGTTQGELRGHKNGVSCVAVTPDGKYAVSGSGDDTLRVWDLCRRREVEPPLVGHTSWVRDVAIADEGRTVVSAGDDGTIRLWDLTYCGRFHRRDTHRDWVTGIALLNRERAISASADGTLKLWNTTSATTERTLEAPRRRISCFAVSADGCRAVSGSDDGTITLWDLREGKCVETFAGRRGAVNSVAISADGRKAVSGSVDRRVIVWDLDARVMRSALAGIEDSIRAVAQTPDGRVLVGSASGTLLLWEMDQPTPRTLCSSRVGINAVAIVPDRAVAISGHDDGTLRMWDLERCAGTGDCLLGVRQAHAKRVYSLACDDNWIVSASSDNTVAVWQLPPSEKVDMCEVARFTADAEVHCCAIGTGGIIAVGDASGATHFLTLRNAPQLPPLPPAAWAVSV
jgi:WD40 repeat protein